MENILLELLRQQRVIIDKMVIRSHTGPLFQWYQQCWVSKGLVIGHPQLYPSFLSAVGREGTVSLETLGGGEPES